MEIKLARNEINGKPKAITLDKVTEIIEKEGQKIFYFDKENSVEVTIVDELKEPETSVQELKTSEEVVIEETVTSLTTNPEVLSLAKQLSAIDFGYIDVQEKKAEISKQIKMKQEELQILDMQYIEIAKSIVLLHKEYKELG